ncbi:MAG: AAA family ATPase [Terracidiphilus sp.]
MKLRSVAVNQFKKFSSPVRLAGIGDGLNVVIGPNEMGKSTLLDALRAALFEKHNSKAQPIVALQNDRNEAGPVVELAFELGDGLYRITKRFIKKPYARLSCPDGRILEGDAAEDTLRGLLGFDEPGKTGAKAETLGMWNVLWVQQGQSFGQFEIPSTARSSLHSALEAEVGTVLGGRRGRALPQVIETHLLALITSAGKPRGPYKDLIDRTETLREDLATIQLRRKELSQTFGDLETAQENLARLSVVELDQADQNELNEAQQHHSQLAELEARISNASTELELKKLNLTQAEKAAQDRQHLNDEVESEETALKEFAQRLAAAREHEEGARLRLNALRANVREQEAVVTKADDAVSHAQRILTVIGRQARIGELESRSANAQAAEERYRSAQQEAAAILVTDQSLAAIRKAEKDLEAVANRLSAVATLVSFDIAPDRRLGIEVDGQPLRADQSFIQAVEATTIVIPDRGRITIDPAIKDRDKLMRQSRDTAGGLKDALTAVGVTTAGDAESQYATRQRLLQEAELARLGAALHAPATDDRDAGAQALADYIVGLRTILNREKADLNLDQLPLPVEAEEAQRLAQEHAAESRGALQEARGALVGPEEELARLYAELASVSARHEDSEQRVQKLQRQLTDAVAAISNEELEAAIPTAQFAVSEQERTIAGLEAQRTDETLPQLEARIGRLERALRDRREKRSTLKEEIASLRSRVEAAEAAGLDEAIAKKEIELELCEKERVRIDREVKVLALLQSTLQNAERVAKERYLSPVLRRVRPYLQLLFPGADIRIDEDMQITGVVREADYEEAFHHLSMGTQEQIAVLIRLAFAEMLVEQGHPATVVLDDALVFSDDRRMKRMFDILNMAARHVQVLVLTCREQLFEELGGRSLSLTAGSSEELISA